MLNKIEYLVLLVAAFAARTNVSEVQAYRYLNHYGALALCDKHYGIMHTLSLEENIQTIKDYCQRKGGNLWNSITALHWTYKKLILQSLNQIRISVGHFIFQLIASKQWRWLSFELSLRIQGYITFEEFHHRIQYIKGITFQYAFCTQEAVDKLIKIVWTYLSLNFRIWRRRL